MATKKQLLDVRKKLKARKPVFLRQSVRKLKRLAVAWRRPTGGDSKLRLNRRGHTKQVSTGYGSPAAVRHYHPSGLFPIYVSSIRDMKIMTQEQGIIIKSGVGERLRLLIIKEALAKKHTILNIKNPQQYLTDAQEELRKRKEEKSRKVSAKQKKKEELKKETEKKQKDKKHEEKKSEGIESAIEEEKKAEEKKKMDERLIHTQ